MLNSAGESGQPWCTPLLISTDFESLCQILSLFCFVCKYPLLPIWNMSTFQNVKNAFS